MGNQRDLYLVACRQDFRTFVDFAFRELHPGQKLSGEWHIDLIADRIESVARGATKRLILNAPPRTLKSLIATISLSAFYSGKDPTKRILLLAGSQSLAGDLMIRLRKLMASQRYCSIFPHMRRVQYAATTIRTPHGGGVRSAVVGQQLSGHGADLVIVDDPLSPSHAQDDQTCSYVNRWHDFEVMQRLNKRSEGAFVLVMQRVHSDDLSGHLMYRRDFSSLVLPSVATRDEEWDLSDGRRFVRKRSEVLDPCRDDIEQQLRLLDEMGSYTYATQYLQETCGSRDGPAQFKWGPKPDDWSPENASIKGGVRRTTLRDLILHGAFGQPLPDHHYWTMQHPLTDDEWEAGAAVLQRRLAALDARSAEPADVKVGT